MKPRFAAVDNQEGSVIVVALLILLLLTLLGVSATQNSVFELQIVRNDKLYKQHFYAAEAAALQGAQVIENMPPDDLNDISDDNWITQMDVDDEILNNIDMTDAGQNWWQVVTVDPDTGANASGYTIVDQTGLIDLSAETNLHSYTVLGIYDLRNHINEGRVVISLGYKRRF